MEVVGNSHLNLNVIQLNIEEVRAVFSLIFSCGHEGVINSVMYAFLTLTSEMQHQSKQYHLHSPCLKLFWIVLLHPQILDVHFSQVVKSLFDSLHRVPRESHSTLIEYISSLAPSHYSHFLNIFRQYINERILQNAIKEARVGVKCLDLLHSARLRSPHLLNSIEIVINLTLFP
jgi:hypothetical protein